MAFSIKSLFKNIGPGFITGAADDDPSGIATYSQSGAQFGYHLLWMSLFTFPFMTVIQEICGRVGIVTGKGLARLIKDHYPKYLLYLAVSVLTIANVINIGADLGAMAAALQLIIKLPMFLLLVIITGITLLLEIVLSYKIYSKFLKYLAISLFAYVITVFVVKQNWSLVFYHLIFPEIKLNHDYIQNVVAILGTTISPYLFFWQTSEEIEEEIVKGEIKDIDAGHPKFNDSDIKDMRYDTISGMLYASLIMFFIMVTTASTLNTSGIFSIDTAAEAALALKPLAGNFASFLFCAGIIGTGLLTVPILAGSASYAISDMFSWKEGLSKKLMQARGFYSVIVISTIVGLLINLTPIKPFKMLYYTAILNGICSPILLYFIIKISGNSKIMGKYTNSMWINLLSWAVFAFMTISAVLLFV